MAVVVDDLDAGITHVVRGADHYSNTPKQMLILEALGEQPPVYAHVPLLHGPDGKKLSKRHGAASVQELRDKGYLPEAVINYLALLGWGESGGEESFYSIEELQRRFALERVSRSPAIFDEQKLRWMNGRYLRELSPEDLQARLEALYGRELRRDVVEISQEKVSTLTEFWPLSGFFFDGPSDDPKARRKVLEADGAHDALAAARVALDQVPDWSLDGVQAALERVVTERGVKPGKVYQPVRVALAGTTVSPGIFETVTVLGRDETLNRLDATLGDRS
jgi:glutamyl-tRNA synthetase